MILRSAEADPANRKKSDKDEIANMLHEINCDSVNSVHSYSTW